MKLPDALSQLLGKKEEGAELYLSLILDIDHVTASAWQFSDRGLPHILATATKTVVSDSWDDRTQAADRALGEVEDAIPATSRLTKVILGLPQAYLTPNGEILKDVRVHMKKLTRVLTLEPIGFVPIQQAIIFKLKKDEGIPPSVILLHAASGMVSVSIYKVGTLVGQREVEHTKDVVHGIEAALKDFTELEVLPARMLLYNGKSEDLDALKADLLKYPWPTKVNFLHFPKIEILTHDRVVAAVSYAGASELGSAIGDIEDGDESPTAAPSPGEHVVSANQYETVVTEAETPAAEDAEETGLVASDIDPDTVVVEASHDTHAHDVALDAEVTPDDDNVVLVDPEELGFHKHASAARTPPPPVMHEQNEPEDEEEEEERDEADTGRPGIAVPAFFSQLKMPSMPHVSIPRINGPVGGFMPAAAVVGFLVLLVGLMYVLLPHASVTVYQVAQPVVKTLSVVIDPTATVVAASEGIVPGRKQEQSVTGEKTVPVTGKKNIGDPAKGTVTIYNKSLSSRTFRKGTVITASSLQFTLNDDVSVASASESVGSITFGKASVSVTAAQIGPKSNLASGTEFSFKDVSTSIAIARNEAALSGGTSKEVTVVTRADYDNFIKRMTTDLVDQAKKELTAKVGGNEKLIDDTIETSVTEKVFDQEIDEEATELSGKVTITVTGISYSDEDLVSLASDGLTSEIPEGYTFSAERTEARLSDMVVKKDGSITASAEIQGVALPTMDAAGIRSALAGKSLSQAETYLRSVTGVGAVGFSFRASPTKSRLPINKNNIAVTFAVQE